MRRDEYIQMNKNIRWDIDKRYEKKYREHIPEGWLDIVPQQADIMEGKPQMLCFAFDVDETLEVSGGPISLHTLYGLWNQGNIVGNCGNYAALTLRVPMWHRYISFLGPMNMTKEDFLKQIKSYVPADRYIMVGNIRGISGASDDQGAAQLADWEFVKESDFIGSDYY